MRINVKNIVVVDLSWKLHSYRHSLSMLSIERDVGGRKFRVPTGHVYGVIDLVVSLSKTYDHVILAVDSHRKKFKQVCPTYKSGRRTPSGDPYQDYNIYEDLINIITICTSLPNVSYIKESGGRGEVHPLLEDGLEADHIIQSLINDTLVNDGYNLTCCFNDNDTLRNGNYVWLPHLDRPPEDRLAYVLSKYGIPISYVPSIQSILHGQSSDNFPPVFKGIPSKLYQKIMMDLKDSTDEQEMVDYLTSESFLSELSSTWKQRFLQLKDENSEPRKIFHSNFVLVNPVIVPVKCLEFKKRQATKQDLITLFNYYQINYNKLNYFSEEE